MAKIIASRFPGVFRYANSQYFTIRYQKNGKRVEESTKFTLPTEAKALRDQRLGEILGGTHVDRKKLDVTIDVLFQRMLNNKRSQKQAAKDAQTWERHLKGFVGGMRAIDIENSTVTAYIADRQRVGTADGTINRELSALQSAFTYAVDLESFPVQEVPNFKKLRRAEAGPRKGFLYQQDYDAMVTKVDDLWFRCVLEIGYCFGLRLAEVMTLKARQINLAKREIMLEETKNGEQRTAPMTSKVYELLCFQMSGKAPGDYLFTYDDGTRIQSFYKRWKTLVESIGRPELIFHDFRRCAMTNMLSRGMSLDEAMLITGHLDPSVAVRYKIRNTRNLHQFAAMIEGGANREREASARAEEQMQKPVRHVS